MECGAVWSGVESNEVPRCMMQLTTVVCGMWYAVVCLLTIKGYTPLDGIKHYVVCGMWYVVADGMAHGAVCGRM